MLNPANPHEIIVLWFFSFRCKILRPLCNPGHPKWTQAFQHPNVHLIEDCVKLFYEAEEDSSSAHESRLSKLPMLEDTLSASKKLIFSRVNQLTKVIHLKSLRPEKCCAKLLPSRGSFGQESRSSHTLKRPGTEPNRLNIFYLSHLSKFMAEVVEVMQKKNRLMVPCMDTF